MKYIYFPTTPTLHLHRKKALFIIGLAQIKIFYDAQFDYQTIKQ